MSESLLKGCFWEEGRLGLCERLTFFSQRLQLGKGLSSPGAAAGTLDGTPSQGVGLGFYCKRLLSWYCQDLIQTAVPPAAGQHCLHELSFLQVTGTSDITSTDGLLHQEDGTCCGRHSEDTDHRTNECAHFALWHNTESLSKSRMRKGRRDHPMCYFHVPSEASPTFWPNLGYFDIFEDFLYGYPNELHPMHPCIQGHVCHALSLKSSYSEQCLRKEIIPRPLSAFQLFMVPHLATSEEQCLAWPSVEPGPLQNSFLCC